MKRSVEQRIERVVSHLFPQTAFEDRYDSPRPLNERMARYHTPGASLAVIDDFEIEWARGFGVREAGKPDKVTPTTLFQAGSISKPVSALALMRLVQEGRLDLDEDVNAYLKSWRVPANGDWQPRITLRQILSHSAGLTVHGFPGYQSSEPIPSVPEILNGEPPANTAKVEVNVLPGLQFRYSGGGTTVAQQVLIDVLGRPFPEIMRALVLDPLGMTHSTFEQPLPGDWATRAATAHPWKSIPLRGKRHVYPEMAAAGLWTTATDLAKVGVELLKALHGKPHNLLAKETVDAMLSPQLPGQDEEEGEYAGLGFFCRGKGDGSRFGHAGWDEGFVALMRVYRHAGKGAVVMLNSNEGDGLLEEIMRAVAYEYEWPDVFPPQKKAMHLAQIDRYTGVYLIEAGVKFSVTGQDGSLLLQLERQTPLPIFAASELDFFARAVNAKIAFERDESGAITALTVSQEGKQMRAERKRQEQGPCPG
jgi:CubicO group peptidase (beta-lactamase class C family)